MDVRIALEVIRDRAESDVVLDEVLDAAADAIEAELKAKDAEIERLHSLLSLEGSRGKP